MILTKYLAVMLDNAGNVESISGRELTVSGGNQGPDVK